MYLSENWSLQEKEGEPLVIPCYHDSNQWSLTKVVGGSVRQNVPKESLVKNPESKQKNEDNAVKE